MKKCLSLLIALSMLTSLCVFPVSAEEATTVDIPEGATLIFAEDFEDGFAEGNLLKEGETEVNITNTKTSKNAMWFKYHDTTTEQVTVEAGPDAFNTSKVLKIYTSYNGDMISRIYLDNGNDISTTSESSPYYGKQIVLEYDVMVKGANGEQDNPFMQLRPSTGTSETTPSFLGYANNQIQFRHGTFAGNDSADLWKRDWYNAYQIAIGNKSHVKAVVEQNMTDFDSTRFYLNGALINKEASRKTDWNTGRKFKDFIVNGGTYAVNGYAEGGSNLKKSVNYGDLGSLYSEVRANYGKVNGVANTFKGDATVYIDNIKVYAVDALNFEGFAKDQGVDLEAGVVANFSAPFDATTDTFALSLASDDTKIEGAIKEVVMFNGNTSAAIKFDTAVLGDNKEFKLWAAEDLTSKAGAIFYKDLDGVKAGEEYVVLDEFLTYIPFELAGEVSNVSGLIPNDPRKVEIKTSIPAEKVVATYAGGNVTASTLGTSTFISFENIDTPVDGDVVVALTSEDGQTVETTFAVTAKSDAIEYIYNDNLEGLAEGSLITDGEQVTNTNGNFVITSALNKNITADVALKDAGDFKIVKDAEQGNVLEMHTLGYSNLRVLYKADKVYDTDAKTDSGKVLVIQTKYKVPSGFTGYDGTNWGAFNNYAASTTGARQLSLRYTGNQAYLSSGRWPTPLNNTEGGTNLAKNEWVEYTTVVDQSHVAKGNNPHTFRFYNGGKLVGLSVGRYKEVYPDATVIPKVYDFAPASYQGLWDYSGLAGDYTAYGVIATGDFAGTFTEIPAAGGYNKGPSALTETQIKESQHSVYMDDFRAFFADKFVVTSVSENKSAFVPTKHALKVVFNQKVSADQLSYISLVNEATGEVVEGLKAETANGGYGIDFALPVDGVEIGSTYKLVFTPEFHDITSYQGLTTNNHDYEIGGITIAEFVAFTAEVDTPSFTAFEQGKTTKANIKLSVATKLTDTDVKSAFKVVNSKGEEVTEGWTAKVSADQMTITLDFTNLATDHYTVTSNDKLVNKDGDKLDGADVAITITARINKIMLFEEDFEGTDYTLNENWVETKTAPTNNKFALYVQDGATAENNFVGVVEAPEKGSHLTGKALKIYNDKAEGKRTAVKALLEQGLDIEGKYPGKVIVYEGDIYAVSTADGSNMFIPSYKEGANTSQPLTMKYSGLTSFKIEGSYFSPTASSYSQAHKAQFAANHSTNASNAHMKFVIDENNKLSTIRYYKDGVVVKDKEHTYLTDHINYGQPRYDFTINTSASTAAANDNGTFYGVLFYPKGSTSANAEFYIDNLKIYLVDAFKIESVEGASEAFNPAKNTIKINFSNKLLSKENAAEYISVVDVKTGVTQGATVTIAEGGYQAVVDLDDDLIGAEYKIVVDPLLSDEFGNGLAIEYKWYDYTSTGGSGVSNGKEYTWTMKADGKVAAFNPIDSSKPGDDFSASCYIRDRELLKLDTFIKTTKATSLYADAADAVVSGANVKTTLTLTNPEETALPVWYIVAAYGAYNEMIGCQAAQTEIAASDVVKIDIDFNAKSENIESIKLYVWDGYKTMVPYQDAEELKK